MARWGWARRGEVRHGEVGSGMGKRFKPLPSLFRKGSGEVSARFGFWRGNSWYGAVRHGEVRRGMVWRGGVRFGMARPGQARQDLAVHEPWLGMAR